jgi:hypothetical protein
MLRSACRTRGETTRPPRFDANPGENGVRLQSAGRETRSFDMAESRVRRRGADDVARCAGPVDRVDAVCPGLRSSRVRMSESPTAVELRVPFRAAPAQARNGPTSGERLNGVSGSSGRGDRSCTRAPRGAGSSRRHPPRSSRPAQPRPPARRTNLRRRYAWPGTDVKRVGNTAPLEIARSQADSDGNTEGDDRCGRGNEVLGL